MSEETKIQETVEHTEPSKQEDAQNLSNMGNVAALKKGDVVTGKIEKINENEVIVDVGYKFDGVIPLRELSSVPLESAESAVEVGQTVRCKVIQIDDEKEKLILSKRAVDAEEAWDVLQERFEKQEVFETKVADVVKGGLVVDVGVRGFVPASMVERHFVEDFSDYKGRTLRVKVKELDREKNKVILSQKDVLEEEHAARKKEILNSLKVGQRLEGTVQRLTNFGAFVDIGGVDGLVHVSEMSWEHVDKPSDVVNVGDKVQVEVLKVDPENEKVSLSMKAVQPGPWDNVQEEFKVNQIVTGKVKRLASFGAFVELKPGVEGLVHISQIAHRRIATPHEVLKPGDEVKVKILVVNPEEKRISLSIKATEEPPQVKTEKLASELKTDNVSLNQKGFTFTLGEKFGDKLNQLKK